MSLRDRIRGLGSAVLRTFRSGASALFGKTSAPEPAAPPAPEPAPEPEAPSPAFEQLPLPIESDTPIGDALMRDLPPLSELPYPTNVRAAQIRGEFLELERLGVPKASLERLATILYDDLDEPVDYFLELDGDVYGADG